MHYLVDGHNVIGSSRSIRLSDADDEAQLLRALHRWVLRHPRHRVTVVFDRGVYGIAAPRYERVEAIWTRSPQDADARLAQLLARADTKGTRLVTSDRRVVDAARVHNIEIVSSAAFAAALEAPARAAKPAAASRRRVEPKLPRAEVDAWLAEFGEQDS